MTPLSYFKINSIFLRVLGPTVLHKLGKCPFPSLWPRKSLMCGSNLFTSLSGATNSNSCTHSTAHAWPCYPPHRDSVRNVSSTVRLVGVSIKQDLLVTNKFVNTWEEVHLFPEGWTLSPHWLSPVYFINITYWIIMKLNHLIYREFQVAYRSTSGMILTDSLLAAACWASETLHTYSH